jgi:hypothetical protein
MNYTPTITTEEGAQQMADFYRSYHTIPYHTIPYTVLCQ